MNEWYNKRWCHKLTAIAIATTYFILLIFINNTSYVWATLAIVFVLFITTFTCASTRSPILLHLRGTRAAALTSRNDNEETEEGLENQEVTTSTAQQQMTIWVTDVPPSYSYVMSDLPPPTPPPSYGSAILMFPPPYADVTKADGSQQEAPTSPSDRPRRLRPLSISTQVSVTSVASDCPSPQIGAISFSTQISLVNGTSDPFSDTVSLRTHLFLSRQVSREDIPDNDDENAEHTNAIELHNCNIPVIILNDGPSNGEESSSPCENDKNEQK